MLCNFLISSKVFEKCRIMLRSHKWILIIMVNGSLWQRSLISISTYSDFNFEVSSVCLDWENQFIWKWNMECFVCLDYSTVIYYRAGHASRQPAPFSHRQPIQWILGYLDWFRVIWSTSSRAFAIHQFNSCTCQPSRFGGREWRNIRNRPIFLE